MTVAAVLLSTTAMTGSGAARADSAPAAANDPAEAGDTTLDAQFADPPASARPRVWWHWMNGNVTEKGIDEDLAWMKRIGLGGVQNFDVGLGAPKVVDRTVGYMTPEWKALFRHTASLADRLNLELAIAASPGWSETGGPWVQPADGMKKLVWSETSIPGGRHFKGKLAAPPQATGLFGDDPRGESKLQYYSDVRVIAVPEAALAPLPPAIYADGAGHPIDATALIDGSLATKQTIAPANGQAPVVTITFAAPRTVRSATVFLPGIANVFFPTAAGPHLEVRDGDSWRPIAELPLMLAPTTVSFPAVTGREFRMVFPGSARTYSAAELKLSAEPRVDRFEAKAGFAVPTEYYPLNTDPRADEAGIAPGQVIDLTGRMAADGTLDWTPPRGRWKVLRFGSSLVGVTNHPARPDATGLEVDKYDREVVKRYMDTYLGTYRNAVGADLMGSHGLRAVVTDSIEVGPSNWTPRLIEQFTRLRGYDPVPWLPTLAGVVVGSRTQSDAFLYDFRRTLADLVASEHYGQVARSAHENGLKVYGESHEGGRTSLGDDMAMRAHADIPMAAMWTYAHNPQPGYIVDMRGAASVAHVYGQNLVAAESLTSRDAPWAYAPSDLQPMIDMEFASGVNRPVIHTSVHQPVDKAPGLSLAIFGQHFTRLDTWAEMARPWIDYIARNSLMLQQGRNVADVGYFHGEEAPLMKPFGDEPQHYAFDYLNADMLTDALSVADGDIVARGGARYRVLYLGGSARWMTLPVLRRIAALAEAGGTIVGDRPEGSPSLKDDRAEFTALAGKLWSGAPVTAVGRGKVIAGKDVEAALASAGALPDFTYAPPQPDSRVLFVHRKLADGDVYYLTNRQDRVETIEARFRVTGKQPEIWRADTGRAVPVSYRTEGGQTIVPLQMAARDSFFVVFRKPATAAAATVAPVEWKPVGALDGAWAVSFQPGRGAPAGMTLPKLGSYTDQADPGVKYFSGVASYTRSFTLPKRARPGAPLMLDLGKVADVAEVRVNGTLVGTAWRAPYRVDIGSAAKRGRNTLEVRVANLWVNRLIGDAQPGAEKIAFTAYRTYSANAALRPAGLLGPVTLLTPTAAPGR